MAAGTWTDHDETCFVKFSLDSVPPGFGLGYPVAVDVRGVGIGTGGVESVLGEA